MFLLRCFVIISAFNSVISQDTRLQQCSNGSNDSSCKNNILVEKALEEYIDQLHGQGQLWRSLPRNCKEWLDLGYTENGEYLILPPPPYPPFTVYCDMVTDGGGWAVLQRRIDGFVDFPAHNWEDYAEGFGSLKTEHWIGNRKMHAMTRVGIHELRLEFKGWEGQSGHSKFSKFSIGSEEDLFKLSYDAYIEGDAGNKLHVHAKGSNFTTQDRDNDRSRNNCARVFQSGGWWFGSCFESNLNGRYINSSTVPAYATGVLWGGWPVSGRSYSLMGTEMKTRPSQ